MLTATGWQFAPQTPTSTPDPLHPPHLTDILLRTLLGIAASCAVAGAARRARALDRTGAIAAIVVGSACVAAGWDWAALVVAFFIGSTILSRLGRARKEQLAAGVLTKGSERDAVQVLANGGAFAFCAVGYLLRPSAVWYAVGTGALAAATADTWATEVGMLIGRVPRSIVSGHRVPPGTSGAITVAGTGALIAGAVLIAGLARAVGWPASVAVAALVGGTVGALIDSLLGATLQARRWCDRCHTATERDVHSCGNPTDPAGGVSWLDNDAVNALSTGVGGLVAGIVGWVIAGRPGGVA